MCNFFRGKLPSRGFGPKTETSQNILRFSEHQKVSSHFPKLQTWFYTIQIGPNNMQKSKTKSELLQGWPFFMSKFPGLLVVKMQDYVEPTCFSSTTIRFLPLPGVLAKLRSMCTQEVLKGIARLQVV